tara:strand:- start:285 stop:464 length:180 start_codon:yes stop_codon:yes gene_type:complete
MTGTNLFQRGDANYLEVKGWGSSELATPDAAANSLYTGDGFRGCDSGDVSFGGFSRNRC